jgi:4-hydroxybenzoate polyprenyltransferase
MNKATNQTPLYVDLDGTLVTGDLLFEAIVLLCRKNLFYLLLIPLWLLRGKSQLKQEVFSRAAPDVEILPYTPEFLDYLKKEKENNRTLVLATASSHIIGRKVCDHLGLFSDLLASDSEVNLKGRTKATAITEHCKANGFGTSFAYAGNEAVDIAVWEQASEQIAVNCSSRFRKSVLSRFPNTQFFDVKNSGLRTVIKAIRVHQYAKNLLLFLPALMAHQMLNTEHIQQLVMAFFGFSFIASSVYLLNDLCDIENDRNHKSKFKRPIAAGSISIPQAVLLGITLITTGLTISASVSMDFLAMVLLYLALTTSYSLYTKRIAIADSIFLACLYTLRVLAGGVAVMVDVSEWLIAFSMFFFLSLAFAKRFAELQGLLAVEASETKGRGYVVQDLGLLSSCGVASGYLSVLVLALYVNSDQVRSLYTHPEGVWLICPVMLYWITRVWFIAHRGQLDEDPVVFATTDAVSYAVVIIISAFLIISI